MSSFMDMRNASRSSSTVCIFPGDSIPPGAYWLSPCDGSILPRWRFGPSTPLLPRLSIQIQLSQRTCFGSSWHALEIARVVKICRVIVGGKEDGAFFGAVLSRVDHSQPRSFGRGFGRCSRLLPACQDEHGDVGLEPSLWHDRQGDAESTCDEAPRGAADKWR